MAENTQAPVRSQGWVNDPTAFPTELPSGVERTDKYYAYKTVYEDGRVEWTYYKRDSGPKPQEGQPPQDQPVATDSTIATGIRDEWNKTHVPTATSQATAARDTVTVDGRVKKYNPATGNYDLDQGAAGTSAASAAPTYNRETVEGRPGVFVVKAGSKDQNGTVVTDTYYTDAAGNRIDPPTGLTEKETAAKKEKDDKENETKKNKWTEISRKTDKNEQTGQTTVIITERNDLGETRERNASESVTQKPEKPTYREIEGKTYEVKPDGTLVPARIEGQKPGGPIPTIDPSAHLSVIGSAVQAQLQKLYDDPNLTEAQKQQRAQIIVNAGDTFLREQQGLVTTQSNAMTQGITQRGQDLTEAAGRRNTAESIWNTAYKGAMDNAKYLPAGSGDTGFNAMLGNMLLAHGSIAAAGGYKNVPREQPGPALATANAQPLSTAGGSPYTINVNVGAPPTGAPASVQQAVQPPPSQPVPQVPGGGFLPPGSPMNFTGGQLRAPGYTAPPEDPMDQYNGYPGFMQGMLAA